jgi:hypothetical protein
MLAAPAIQAGANVGPALVAAIVALATPTPFVPAAIFWSVDPVAYTPAPVAYTPAVPGEPPPW